MSLSDNSYLDSVKTALQLSELSQNGPQLSGHRENGTPPPKKKEKNGQNENLTSPIDYPPPKTFDEMISSLSLR